MNARVCVCVRARVCVCVRVYVCTWGGGPCEVGKSKPSVGRFVLHGVYTLQRRHLRQLNCLYESGGKAASMLAASNTTQGLQCCVRGTTNGGNPTSGIVACCWHAFEGASGVRDKYITSSSVRYMREASTSCESERAREAIGLERLELRSQWKTCVAPTS